MWGEVSSISLRVPRAATALDTINRTVYAARGNMHLGRVIGKFRLDRRLGSGAMGDVFLGVHVELGSFVAVKILNAAASAEPNGVARFLNEARAVAAIDHEQIARVIDQDRLPDGTPYIVMEYVEGTTLRELLEERGPLGLRLTVDLMLDVLSALTVAHARGIVHRDLKPENIRVTRSGRAKILDFGIAKLLHAVPTPLTQQGMLVGTPYYMSPEQIDGRALDGRSDLYAVGVMLFECVTGRRPFEGSTVVALLHRHLQEAPPSVRALRVEAPAALERSIFRALEKQAAQRFATAEQFAETLREVSQALPPDGPVVRRPTREQPLATPSIEAPQGTTEDALGNTVRTPLTRRFKFVRPLQVSVVVLLVVLGGGWLADVRRVAPRHEEGTGAAPPIAAPVAPRPSEAVKPSQPPKDPEAGSVAAPPAAPGAERPAPRPLAKRQQGGPGPKPEAAAVGAPPVAVALATPEPLAPAPRQGVTMIETAKDRSVIPADFDPKAFEPLVFLRRAEALARARMPDVVLVSFDVSGLFSGERVDLTLSKEFEANYVFRSPKLSVADPRLRDDDQDIPCLIHVEATAKHIETFVGESYSGCKEKQLPRIACPLSYALGRAEVEAPDKARKSMSISWLADGWYLNFGSSDGSLSVRCP